MQQEAPLTTKELVRAIATGIAAALLGRAMLDITAFTQQANMHLAFTLMAFILALYGLAGGGCLVALSLTLLVDLRFFGGRLS